MKTTLFRKKLPHIIDYALAIAISTVPGMAEADGKTRQLYQSMAKELLAEELRSKTEFARKRMGAFNKKTKSHTVGDESHL